MKRIDTGTRAIDLFGPGKDGFRNGDLANGITPTDLNADWFNGCQEEVANVVEACGIELDGAVLTQLVQALRTNALLHRVDTGAANACVLTYSPAILALVDGMVLSFKAAASNSGATTLNVDGIGAKAVLGAAHAALQGGEIVAGGRCTVVWNTALSSFILIGCTGAALQVGAATQAQHAARLGQFLMTSNLATGTGSLTVSNSFTAPSKGIVFTVGIGNGYGGTGIALTGATLVRKANAFASSNGSSETAIAHSTVAAGASVVASFNAANVSGSGPGGSGDVMIFNIFLPTA